MKLTNFNKLVASAIDSSEMRKKEIAGNLGLAPANISIWISKGDIPERHLAAVVRELKIPPKKAIKALKKDIAEIFK